MTRFGGYALLLAAMTAPAWAGGYSDFNAGISARDRGNATEAILLFTSALNAPDLPKQFRAVAYLDRGMAYRQGKKDELALADFTASLAIHPNDVVALEERGYVYQHRKQFDLAQADFEAEVAGRPDAEEGLFDLVKLNISRKTFEAALKFSNDAIEKWPHSETPYILRADTYRAMGKAEEALDDYDTAAGKGSNHAYARFSRARFYIERGDLEKALSDLKDASDDAPNWSDLRNEIGFVQWDLGRFDEAAKMFRTRPAAETPGSYEFLWMYLSEAKQNSGRYSKLTEDTSKLDQTLWPIPVIKLFSGSMTADEVMKAAATGDTFARPDQLCEANFYVGEWQLLHSDALAGKTKIGTAASTCETGFAEKAAARAELARLN